MNVPTQSHMHIQPLVLARTFPGVLLSLAFPLNINKLVIALPLFSQPVCRLFEASSCFFFLLVKSTFLRFPSLLFSFTPSHLFIRFSFVWISYCCLPTMHSVRRANAATHLRPRLHTRFFTRSAVRSFLSFLVVAWCVVSFIFDVVIVAAAVSHCHG